MGSLNADKEESESGDQIPFSSELAMNSITCRLDPPPPVCMRYGRSGAQSAQVGRRIEMLVHCSTRTTR